MERLQVIRDQVSNIYSIMNARQNCRGLLTMLAAQLGSLPQVREMCCSFTDRVRYPGRPMITLYDGQPSVYLLGWREGEGTEIHDHGSCEVGIYVIQGVVMEDIFVPGQQPQNEGDDCQCLLAHSRFLKQGDMVTCPEQYIHRVSNVFPEAAATLHVYGPALEKMKIFQMLQGVLRFTSCWNCSDQAAPH